MPPLPPTLLPLAAVTGALAAWAGVTVTVLMMSWNKLDKRFDDLEARQDKRVDDLEARQDKRFDDLEARQDKQFDEIKAEIQENRAEMRALREALLAVKA